MTKSDGTRASPRPLRRDAALNLERIVVAAQYAFAKSGFEASMEEIARRAGVGVGTIYRRFPNKECLLIATVEMINRSTRQLVDEVLKTSTEAEGIFEFLRRCVAMPSSVRALDSRPSQVIETHLAMVESLSNPVTELIENAKEAGSIRADVNVSDIALILLSVRAVEDRWYSPNADVKLGRQQGERHLQLLIDGLRLRDSSCHTRSRSRAERDDPLFESERHTVA